MGDGIGGRAALRGKLVGHLGEQALKVVLVDDSAAPPEVALHLAQDVIEELELELADREAKRRRLVVQSSYASVLLFALAEPADLVLVRWPAGMVSVAKVMSAPAEAALEMGRDLIRISLLYGLGAWRIAPDARALVG